MLDDVISIRCYFVLEFSTLSVRCITEKLFCIAKRGLRIASRSIVPSYLSRKEFLCLIVMASLTGCSMMFFPADAIFSFWNFLH